MPINKMKYPPDREKTVWNLSIDEKEIILQLQSDGILLQKKNI